MTTAGDTSRAERYVADEVGVQLTGVQAIVRVLLDRVRDDRSLGRRTAGFVSGYEGSPLAGLDLELGRQGVLLAEHDLTHRPALNEELAATAVFGTQLAPGIGGLAYDGVFGAWYGKAPGLDRASDALRHANMAGTHPRGGAVAFVGDDPAASSSSVPSGSENILADLGIPVLFPSDSQDVVDFGRHAFEMSRAAGVWTSVKIVTSVADASSVVRTSSAWRAPAIDGGYTHRPNGRLLGAELAGLERSLYEIRSPLVLDYVRASGLNRISGSPDARIGIVAAGKSFLDVREALLSLGIVDPAQHGVRLLKLGVVSPLDPTIVREFAEGLREIVVVEEKRGIVERAVKDVLYGRPDAPAVRGKDLFPAVGTVEPDRIASILLPKVPTAVKPPVVRRPRALLPVVNRTPYFCSGCPHNSSTKAPEGALVGAGIGCHTMVLFQSSEDVGAVAGITQMGGEGAQWIGAAPFVEAEHWIQNLGDGTFWHSGSLAVRDAVAAGVNVTFKLLHNSAVAMTGGQHPVGSAELSRLAALLLDEGVRRIVVTTDAPRALRRTRFPAGVTVRDRGELLSVQEELARVPGVTVLIHDQECATEVKRKRRRGVYEQPASRIAINELVCEGCGDCGAQSNCLSVRPVDTDFGTKTRIHQESCTVDRSCVQGNCPSFVEVRPTSRRRSGPRPLESADLPEPTRPVGTDAAIRFVGIGGTGVVTAAQILARAAFRDGCFVRTLDQTGLAQKGGAVVSDVRISARPEERAANIATAGCDVYLVGDIVAATDTRSLRALRPDRSIAIVSDARVPTGAMVTGRAEFPDADGLLGVLRESALDIHILAAHAVSEEAGGSDQFANLVLLGAAFQRGCIPLSAASIEGAIAENGVEVEKNVQAFRRGRLVMAAGGTTREREPAAEERTETDELDALVARRFDELVSYHDERYARSYAEFVAEVRASPGGDTAVAGAVARELFRLMAYKDEYEVARLSLDARTRAALDHDFGEGSTVRYLLRPPVFSGLGLRRKVSVGPWFRVVFRILRALRVLRGTFIDPFGRTAVRRRERSLIEEYRRTVSHALRTAPGDPVVEQLADLPRLIRGFEEIKLDSIAEYDRARVELLARMDARPAPAVAE